jgi:hypothetical protein
MLVVGKILGPVLFLLLLVMIIAGYSRRKIGKNFGKYHRFGALLVLIVALTHATILFLKVGPPNTAWHLCGTFAVIFAILTMVVGHFRLKIGPEFIVHHQRLAWVSLVLAVLHRVLAFI